MKGFKDPQGKFRPTENKNGVRKSRDQSKKTEGIKLQTLRKQRGISVSRLPDFHISRHTWGLEFANGKVESVRLGNMVDTGWYWAGQGDQFNTFMARMSDSDVWNELVSDFKEEEITVDIIKSALLKNLSGKLTGDNDDGLYALSGDNSRWKFGEDDESAIYGEFDHFKYEGELKDNEEEEFEKEFWNHYKNPTYERWLEVKGNGFREELKDGIKNATDFDELREAYKDVEDNIVENFSEFLHTESIASASWDAVEAIKARRDEEGKPK